MKGAVNLEGLFSLEKKQTKKSPQKSRPFAFSIQLETNSFFRRKNDWGSSWQVFGSPESPVVLPGQSVRCSQSSGCLPFSFTMLINIHALSHTHHVHTHSHSWWRQQVRESCTCCPVNKIPQSDAETSSFTQKSSPQV